VAVEHGAAGVGGGSASSTSVAATSGSGGAVVSSSSTSTAVSSSSGAACGDGGMPIPTQFKTCASAGDCTEQLIYVDCCGSQEAVGVSTSQVQPFQTFEKACNPVVPACGCKGNPTVAEDGKFALPNAPIQVACNAGLCSTFVP
jgi:hypothetical protein